MKNRALVLPTTREKKGRRLQRPITAAAVLLTTLCLFSACATVAPGPPPIQTLLAYWDAGPATYVCPAGEECVAGFGSLKELEDQIRRQRRLGLELIDFDSGPTSETTSRYVGAWAKSSTPHIFRADLDWSRLLKEQQVLSRRGYRLISLTVYSSPSGSQQIAGIWKRDEGAAAAPGKIVYDLDRSGLEATDWRLRNDGYYLTQIEVYPRPNRPEDRLVAGVWSKGDRETQILWDIPCDLDAETSSALGPGDTERQFLRCELTLRLDALNEQLFRPLDFEFYPGSGDGLWTVLLQHKGQSDWLQIDTSDYFINKRNSELNGPSGLGSGPALTQGPFGLREVVIFYVQALSTHLGVVHDGGTSGPPGG